MRSFAVALGALAVANAWQYPYCDTTNCYNNIVDSDNAPHAAKICKEFLAGTTTAAAAIPTGFYNCPSVQEVSSACSCVTYAATSGLTSTTTSTKSSSTAVSTTECLETSTSTSSSTTKSASYTTSTVYTTKVYTVTSCKPEVTNCPSKPHVTTEVSILYTTVCPVTEVPTPSITKSVGTVTKPTPTTTSSALVVTAAADRTVAGLGAAAIGLVAALL